VALRVAIIALVVAAAGSGPAAAAPSAKQLYTRALAREHALRDARSKTTLAELRALVKTYERIPYRYPVSGYSDNALWQAAGVALLAYERFHEEADRRAGERLLTTMRREYPSSSLVRRVGTRLAEFQAVARAWADAQEAAARERAAAAERERKAAAAAAASKKAAAGLATIRRIVRQPLGTGSRIIIELDGEVSYHEEQLANPPRVFFDFKRTTFDPSLDPAPLAARDDLIKDVRLGAHPDETTRVVMELTTEPRYQVFALYDPYRLVVDFERPRGTGSPNTRALDTPVSAAAPGSALPDAVRASVTKPAEPAPLEAVPTAPATVAAPIVPKVNSDGSFSLARQLGLGVSRIVIDPGHGGHDPGAKGSGVTEAGTVLDIALRLEKFLQAQPGVEVVMTRRTDVFVPLEERTAIANREDADLFLSIHANASRNKAASGVETYFLNFASNAEAEAVAARENSASGASMHNLPDIVKAIALNNKLDESRDLARLVQDAMITRVKPQHGGVRNLGVKQAPFVVLIGAQMPSVLAEVSFITNRTEASLLKNARYRQRIAQALCDAVTRYQHTLKNSAKTSGQ